MRRVIVPTVRSKQGLATVLALRELEWVCPECGGPRGEPSLEKPPYHSSQPKYRLTPRHVWINPCRHHDPLGQHKTSGPAEGIAE